MVFKALDFFAGAGGLSEGLRLAGIDVVLASEIDKWAEITYRHNHPDTIFESGDIAKLTHSRIESLLKKHKNLSLQDVDIIAGGPPCQGFSIIGQRNIDDPRNKLFKEFLRLVTDITPKAFIMENVFGLLSMQNGAVKDEIVQAFTEAGYNVSEPQVLLAANYGVPQLRRRVFFLGIRSDLTDLTLNYPPPTHSLELGKDGNHLQKFVSVNEAISDLPEGVVESTGVDMGEPIKYKSKPKSEFQKLLRNTTENQVYNHHTKRLLDVRMERIRSLNEGDIKTALPPELQSGGHENKYRRLHSKEPSPTLTAHMSKDLSDFIHPTYNRPITVREAARIQSFMDSYIFLGSEFQQFKQIGNAVPPLLGFSVANYVAAQLDIFLRPNKNTEVKAI